MGSATKTFTTLLLVLVSAGLLAAQTTKKKLTLSLISHPQEIVPGGPESVLWRPHSDDFSFIATTHEGHETSDVLWLYSARSRTQRRLIEASRLDLSSAQWSQDGSKLLIEGGGDLWEFDVATAKLSRLTRGGGKKGAAFSPAADRITYVKDNNIYALDLKTGRTRPLTSDGSVTVLNGVLDWVYEEELAYRSIGRAYEWSPDGSKLAYLRLDDGPVPEYPLTDLLPAHATLFRQRFPQPGDPNPGASLRVVAVTSGRTLGASHLPAGAEYISPSFLWAPDSKSVCFLTLNRDQTEEEVHLWNPATEDDRVPVVERDRYWINNVEPPQFVDAGRRFLWLSERDGWMHLYLFSRDGKLLGKLTPGQWMLDHPIFENVPSFEVDEKGGWVYFESTHPDPRQRQLYRVRLSGDGMQQLTRAAGTHALALSPDGQFLIDKFSSVTSPPEVRLLESDGTYLATIDTPPNHLSDYALGNTKFVTVKAENGAALYARLVTPPAFNPGKKYPVVVMFYGGPHFQIVRNQWGVTSWFEQLLSERGFLIWSLDNRGSWGRGHAFETVVFKRLGEYELQDQLAGVRYLKSLPYVDARRIGVWGWSYGGYLTLYLLTHAPQVFKCGIAGAPVTDWHYYDSIYTERYMRTPKENPEGYARSSDVKAASHLRARLLLIHGLADDNVHLQNTINFIQALIEAKVPYELYLQPGQKHGFEGTAAIEYRDMRMLQFFMQNL